MTSFDERLYWHQNTYGSAVRVPRLTLIGALVALCIVTPFTNWMIPFAPKWIRHDLILRY